MEEDLDYSVLLTTVAPSSSACPEDLACPDANYAAPSTLPSTCLFTSTSVWLGEELVSYISKNAVQWLVRIQMDKFKGNFTLT